MWDKDTEYFCFEHGEAYPKEEISCPKCCEESARQHDPEYESKQKDSQEIMLKESTSLKMQATLCLRG